MFSIVISAMVFIFIMLLLAELTIYKNRVVEKVNLGDLISVKKDRHLYTSLDVFLFAYSTQYIVFPLYEELENRSIERYA